MSQLHKILLVEDDPALGFVIKDNLEVNQFDVTWCKDGQEGLARFQRQNFDLCILDVMLPKKDGFTLAESIRKKNGRVPILFLTAKSMQQDKIQGFRTGADDYITKPFSIEELLMRIRVFLKWSQIPTSEEPQVFQVGDYSFDFDHLSLARNGEEKILTQKEADILKLFCQHRGEILKREEILVKVWGEDDYFLGRSMDVFISKLRKYLKLDERIEIINYHGVGFKLEVKE